LRLRLTHHGAEPVDVEVLDFNSDLGNFVVQPAKIAVPPGETVKAEPMTSRLGVPAVDAIPITARLRVSGKTGKVEQQVLTLHPRIEPVPATAGPSG
jgi:plastocyanin